jgi:hypothetical protein
MAGLDPAIGLVPKEAWITGSNPVMTILIPGDRPFDGRLRNR